jgi:hypothetical protein
MNLFEDRKDVEEWLERLDYEKFWTGIEPFQLVLLLRQNCDQQITAGVVDEATVLRVLKAMARLELVERYCLRPRDPVRVRGRHGLALRRKKAIQPQFPSSAGNENSP